MEIFQNPKGTLYKLSREEYETLFNLIRQENPTFSNQARESYGKEDFLREVYLDEEDYDRLVRLLESKKNIILQGAPGVGKSFAARRLAWAMMEEINEEQIELVQFHQNYAYEDFMLGYRPIEEGFQLQYGLFYRFCQRAFNHPEKKFFFLIDL